MPSCMPEPARSTWGWTSSPIRSGCPVSDDGVGLPADYSVQGRGFKGMRADAAAIGGSLIVDGGDGNGGLTITCVVPHKAAD